MQFSPGVLYAPRRPRWEGQARPAQGGGSSSQFRRRTFVSGHFKEYERLGNAAIEVVCNFTLVERISIDEAFADVAGCAGLFG
jgi:DNA polymerase-4